jgi:competence ComEA-like helix-hairpin-helix protein
MRALIFFLVVAAVPGQELREGEGRLAVEKICKGCHEMSRSVSLRQDKEGWRRTLTKMAAFGMKSTDAEFNAALDYLAKYYPAEELPPVNVNKATAIELESRLSLKRSQARAVLQWREQNGPFKSLEDLKKVPALDAAHLEQRKDRIVF